MGKQFTADFETTTDENDCRVWAWGVCEIGNPEYFEYGNDIKTFFEYMESSKNSTFYFHNLKFDGEFIIAELFKQGFKHVTDRADETTKTFTTLISNTGQFYSIKIIFNKGNKKSKFVKLYDSLKIIPFGVAEVAKAFNLPIKKLDLDYAGYREIGHKLTDQEIEYLRNDVEIMARALLVLFDQGLTKMTQGSNALYDYKNIVTEKSFDRWFPLPDYDHDVRQSYKGGFTYLNGRYKNKDIKTGIVLDVNSLYPWVMRVKPLPYGDPIFFKGKYENDDLYPLYVQMFTCQFELKEKHIPTIQLKNNLAFIPTQYIESSDDEEVTMCLTSVDIQLFFEHYKVYNIEYHSGWKFKSATGLFADYIDKWIAVKNESTLNGNKAMRTLAKLMLNSLYGKFGLNPNVQSKIPYNDNGVVKYYMGEKETRNPIYIPVATFITAYARQKTITSAQKLYNNFAYADTDSLHLEIDIPDAMFDLSQKEIEYLKTEDLQKFGLNIPDEIEIDPVKLGAWKVEHVFNRARFIRQKCYIEDMNPPETWDTDNYNKDLLNITCAGMPKQCYQFVTWENFKEGSTYSGKLLPKHVKNGLILQDTEFTIKKI